jgi:hypothetical protein
MKDGGGAGNNGGGSSGFGATGYVFPSDTQPTLSDVKGGDAASFGAGGGGGKTYNDYMLFKST